MKIWIKRKYVEDRALPFVEEYERLSVYLKEAEKDLNEITQVMIDAWYVTKSHDGPLRLMANEMEFTSFPDIHVARDLLLMVSKADDGRVLVDPKTLHRLNSLDPDSIHEHIAAMRGEVIRLTAEHTATMEPVPDTFEQPWSDDLSTPTPPADRMVERDDSTAPFWVWVAIGVIVGVGLLVIFNS